MDRLVFTTLIGLLCPLLACAQEASGWRRPPEPIASLLDAEPPASVTLSPCRKWLFLLHSEGMPSLDVLARPLRRLAGLRIDPLVHGPQLGTRVTKFVLRPTGDGPDWELPLEPGYWLDPEWTADGTFIALPRAADDGIELWIVDVAKRSLRRIDGVRLNAVLGAPVLWLHDQRSLLCKLAIPGDEPPAPRIPTGPSTQETAGAKAQVRTFQDLLQDEHDAALFDFHTTAQLALLEPAGTLRRIGQPARIASVQPSPDDQSLLVSTIERPFSYLVTWESFARRVELIDLDGKAWRLVATLPLQESVPMGGVPAGPRNIQWLPGGTRYIGLDRGPRRRRSKDQSSAPRRGPADDKHRTANGVGANGLPVSDHPVRR